MAETPRIDGRIDLDKPRWQQNTYLGRAKHFFSVTDPRNVLLRGTQFDKAKELLQLYRYISSRSLAVENLPGMKLQCLY